MAAKNKNLKDLEESDLSGYTEYFGEPVRVRAKRLEEDKIYTVLVNGTEQTFKGHKGQIDVFHVSGDGKVTKNEPYDIETFQKKFGLLNDQKQLFEKEKKNEG